MLRPRLLALAVVTMLGACAHKDAVKASCASGDLPGLTATPRASGEAPTHDPSGDVLVRSLGAAGVYLEWQGNGVLISPLFTSYPADPGARKLSPDDAAVSAGLADIDSSNVQVILVGSSHHMDIADLRAVAASTPNADIYVNQSGLNLLAPHLGELEGRGDKKTRVRAVNGEAMPRAAEQWLWLRGSDGGEIPIKIRAVPLKTERPDPGPETGIPWDNLHTNELFAGQRYAFAIELFDEARSQSQFKILAVESGSEPDLETLEGEQDLVIVSLRRYAADGARPSNLVTPTKAAHVMLVDYDQSDARGQWELNPDLDPKWVTDTMCGVESALKTTGLKEREPKKSKVLHGSFWTMPTPGQWLVFPTDGSDAMGDAGEETSSVMAVYDRALLQANEADLDGAWKTVATEIAKAQKEDRTDDPRLAKLYVLAAGVIYSREKDATKARALLDKAVVLDHFVKLPVELSSKKMTGLLKQARGAVSPPVEPISMRDPVKDKERNVSFEAVIQMDVPDEAQLVLYWRKMGVGEFNTLEMHREGNVATATIGAVDHRGSDIEYFVYLFDAKQQPLANRANQEDPSAFFLND